MGIGLARFAYTPLIPALIQAWWFTPAQAVYLSAANLAGYLADALAARPLAVRWPARTLLRVMMLVASASFFGCALQAPFVAYFLWRFVAGLAGGTIMVLAATTVLAHVPNSRRGRAGAPCSWEWASASPRLAPWCLCCCGKV